VEVPKTKVIATCHWPPKKHHDQFCTRRSDTDVFLTDGTDFNPSVEYDDTIIDARIDYVETFPGSYEGTPNMTVTHDGQEVYPQVASFPEADIVEYSPQDETFFPGSEIELSQNQHNLAVAGIFEEVDSPNLQRHKNSRIEEPESFFPENAKSKDHSNNPLPDFASNHGGDFKSFGQKLPGQSEQSGTTALILSELDATAFDRSDKGVEDSEESGTETKSGGGNLRQAYNGDSESGMDGFKEDFESSFNPGFSNFGNFEGDPKVTWLWGSKTEE